MLSFKSSRWNHSLFSLGGYEDYYVNCLVLAVVSRNKYESSLIVMWHPSQSVDDNEAINALYNIKIEGIQSLFINHDSHLWSIAHECIHEDLTV